MHRYYKLYVLINTFSPQCSGASCLHLQEVIFCMLKTIDTFGDYIIGAQQAKLTNNCKNTKYKLLKTNAAIWYNKICRQICVITK